MSINKVIKNQYVVLKPFEAKYITKEYVRCLNKKCINQYLSIRHKKQTIKSALNYLKNMEKNKYIYYAIFFKKKNKLIGTFTLRKLNKKDAVLGKMICYKKFFGTKESKTSVILFLSFVFNTTNFTRIYASTEKENIASNFNLIVNNFKLIKKQKNRFVFLLKKSDFKV